MKIKRRKKKRNRNERPTPARYFLLPPVDCMPLSAAVLLKITISAAGSGCAHLSSRKVTKRNKFSFVSILVAVKMRRF